MLSPSSGVTLLEVLEPPDGYRLDVAVGTSYTLDLNALLALPTAFALSHGSTAPRAHEGLQPLELLEALRANAGRMTVFTDAGHIGLPANAGGGVFGFLERSVVPVMAPGGGAFHPKLWAIRFIADDGALQHRLLVASRNLTFDRSWDAMVRLDEAESAGIRLPQTAALLTALLDLSASPPRLSDERSAAIRDLAHTIGAIRFAPPDGFDNLRLHPIGFREHARQIWPFPKASNRALVVSPFLTTGTLASLEKDAGPLVVVSRGDELDRAYANCPESARPRTFEISPNLVDTPDDAAVLTDLHAKIFVFDVTGSRTHVFAGSANATAAAFTQNTEVLLEMSGPSSKVGTRRWLDEANPSLRQMLLPHMWGAPQPAATSAEDALRQMRDQLARLTVTCTVTDEGDGRFGARYETAEPLPSLGEAVLQVRPLSDAAWRPITGTHLSLTVRTPLSGITSFLAVRVDIGKEAIEFIVACRLLGAPEDREDRLLAHLIADPDRLVRYLLMLLTDQPADRFDGVNQAVAYAASRHGADLSTVPLLELLLRTYIRNPQRLASVGRLMDVVRRSPDLRDENLLALWATVSALPAGGEHR